MNDIVRVTVWAENIREKKPVKTAKVLTGGMHETIAEVLRECDDFEVRTATLDMPEHGLTQDVLDQTDVLTWWGHHAHAEVDDKIVDRIHSRVLDGMGLIVLHSGHYAKIFRRLLSTNRSAPVQKAGEKERVWVCTPGHPIAQGIDRYFELHQEEMYGEPFALANPDEIVFLSWFEGGEVRAGCTWHRGKGKIFYFRPGNEAFPTYHNKDVRRVIQNAVRWARPEGSRWVDAPSDFGATLAAAKAIPPDKPPSRGDSVSSKRSARLNPS